MRRFSKSLSSKDVSDDSLGTLAYIGPGAGFAFLGSFLSLVLAVLAGIASMVVWPFRIAWSLLARRRRTQFRRPSSWDSTVSIRSLPKS